MTALLLFKFFIYLLKQAKIILKEHVSSFQGCHKVCLKKSAAGGAYLSSPDARPTHVVELGVQVDVDGVLVHQLLGQRRQAAERGCFGSAKPVKEKV